MKGRERHFSETGLPKCLGRCGHWAGWPWCHVTCDLSRVQRRQACRSHHSDGDCPCWAMTPNPLESGELWTRAQIHSRTPLLKSQVTCGGPCSKPQFPPLQGRSREPCPACSWAVWGHHWEPGTCPRQKAADPGWLPGAELAAVMDTSQTLSLGHLSCRPPSSPVSMLPEQ